MAKDMTNGNIKKHLIQFAVPMILGNLFQLTYNAVDSIIVGKFAGKNSLAAVGCANPIMNIIIFFIIGICMGASVLMSEFYGSGNHEKLKKEVSTTMLVGCGFTIFVSILCFLLAKPILSLIHTPAEILKEAATYLSIICAGLIFTFFYNVYACSLRSIGDSKTPIYFLIISSILNASLDLVFIAVFKLGVVGAALATVIAEATASILCIFYVYKKVPILQLKRHEFVVERSLVKSTINYSWATAMQQTVLYIGKVLVQGAVNPLGVDSIATFNAVNRIDDFAFTPQQSISHGLTTFVAQNRGAMEKSSDSDNHTYYKDRMTKGFRTGLTLEASYFVILCIVVFTLSRPMMNLFVPKGSTSVVDLGVTYLHFMAVFYILPAMTNGVQGYFRGMGQMKTTLIATTVQMIVRVLFSYILAPRFGITGIAFACLAGWTAMLIFEIPEYFRYKASLK